MKLLRLLFISSLLVMNGMPSAVRAQTVPGILILPEGRSGEPYHVQLESVLRDNYRLKVEAGSRVPVFRWGLVSGELPPGLILRMNGTLVGTPRRLRVQPYQFQLRVFDATTAGAAPLKLDFSLTITATQVRLVPVNAPRLVPIGAPAGVHESAEPDDSEGAGARIDDSSSAHNTAPASHSTALASYLTAAEPVRNSRMREAAVLGSGASTLSLIASAHGPADVSNGDDGVKPAAPIAFQGAACGAPTPSPTPGTGVFYLDARNGNLTENGSPVTPRQRFKKNKQVTVVIINKNPYLYTYRYSSTATPIVESALDTFVPFIVGKLGDLGAAPETAKEPDTGGGPAHGLVEAAPTPDCAAAIEKITNLVRDVNAARDENIRIRAALDNQKVQSDSLTDAYNAARTILYSPNQTVGNLSCASTRLVNAVDAGTGAGGINAAALDKTGNDLDALERKANRLISRRDAIREAHASCLDQPDRTGALLGELLREAGERADEILANVKQYRETLNMIRHDLNVALEGRKAAQTVLNDPNAFFEAHSEGGYEASNDVELKLEATPKQGVAEAQAVQGSPFTADFTFGGAPFFSISGGLIFSPLRKREYVRVQGFERDQQGALILKDGKPNLTTVVGFSESSPTRITPAIFLHGRLTDRWNSFIDGVHMTLGLTAKNDNKGTDVEFLVGPSVSLLDGNMFLTAGGYAGRQQKLGGGLFEGFAVPSGVDELPIEKNYRWNFGFSISYRLPVNKPKGSQ